MAANALEQGVSEADISTNMLSIIIQNQYYSIVSCCRKQFIASVLRHGAIIEKQSPV